jgi:Animal haem peroxidase
MLLSKIFNYMRKIMNPSNPSGQQPTSPQGVNLAYRPHGSTLRGAEFPPKSSMFEGKFGRMFRTLPSATFSEKALAALGSAMTAEFEKDGPTPETESDDEENTGGPSSNDKGIAAGYTYLGQFIDHDLTFDPASSLQKNNDPEALVDFRTPRFDLDCIYGRGPDDQPYLYRDDALHMLLGRKVFGSAFDPNTRDVPRNTPESGEPARALIGDPRNDENTIVSQLQSTMLRFHNRVIDFLTQRDGSPPTFEKAQQEVRWHYQWLVLHDFLPTIIGTEVLYSVLPELQDESKGIPFSSFSPKLKFFRWKEEPFIPVEFAVAAYRFGHSMIRPVYRLNTSNSDRFFIFPVKDKNGNLTDGLTGFKSFPEDRAVDWTLFFNIDKNRPELGPERIQPAYKIDTSLVNPLAFLPPSVAKDIPSLAERNLKRSLRMGLPSGQSVARLMGLPVIPDEQLRVGKANAADAANNPSITEISIEFSNSAPLWYYILAESQQEVQKAAQELPSNPTPQDTEKVNRIPVQLGPVGGRIVGEVFVGLLYGDSHSYLRQHPCWKPIPEFCREGRFGIAELILQAKQVS